MTIAEELALAAARVGIKPNLEPTNYTRFSDRRKCPCCGSYFWADGDAASQRELNKIMEEHMLIRTLYHSEEPRQKIKAYRRQ